MSNSCKWESHFISDVSQRNGSVQHFYLPHSSVFVLIYIYINWHYITNHTFHWFCYCLPGTYLMSIRCCSKYFLQYTYLILLTTMSVQLSMCLFWLFTFYRGENKASWCSKPCAYNTQLKVALKSSILVAFQSLYYYFLLPWGFFLNLAVYLCVITYVQFINDVPGYTREHF